MRGHTNADRGSLQNGGGDSRLPRWLRISTYRRDPSDVRKMKLKDYLSLSRIKCQEYPFEQMKLLLYFITRVAGIRDDMTAKVIASRLHNINPTLPAAAHKTQDDIARLLSVHGSVFEENRWDTSDPVNNDRFPGEKAYRLTDAEAATLKIAADKLWLNYFWERTPFTKLTKSQCVFYYSALYIALMAPATIVAILFYVSNLAPSYSPGILNTMLTMVGNNRTPLIIFFVMLVTASGAAAYQIGRGRKSRITGEPPTLQNYFNFVKVKGKVYGRQIPLLLHFITEFAGIRDDMTAKVIASRLHNLGTKITTEQAADTLNDQKMFIESKWDRNSPINDDRECQEKAYRLKSTTMAQLNKETDTLWRAYFWSLTPFSKIEYLILYLGLSCLAVVGLILQWRYNGASIYSLVCFWSALVLASYINGDTSPPSGR